MASKNRNVYLQLWVRAKHRLDGISFFFCFVHVVLLLVCSLSLFSSLVFKTENVVLQTGCIKFNSVVERSSCIDSRVSRILILVLLTMLKPDKNRMNAI